MSLLVNAYSMRAPGTVLCLVVIGPLLVIGNPAIALLVGGGIALSLNRSPIAHANSLGKYCLQTAIVLLGLRLNLETVWQLSASYSWGVASYVLATLSIGLLLGYLLRAEKISTQLVSAGTAICGGTTIATISPIIGAKPHETAVALGLVFLLNVVALIVFPLIGHYLALSNLEFGLWSALAIHDTSSVVATAAIYSEEAAEVATTIKLGRTLWLIPLVLGTSLLAGGRGNPLRVPGFILLFIAATAIGSVVTIPEIVVSSASILSKALLVCALFLVGAELTRTTVSQIHGKVLWHAVLLWMAVAPLTLLVIRAFH